MSLGDLDLPIGVRSVVLESVVRLAMSQVVLQTVGLNVLIWSNMLQFYKNMWRQNR